MRNVVDVCWHNYRHGKKPGAFAWPHSPAMHKNDRASYEYWNSWDEGFRISKCWKDQRGKGRNKRTTQYRPIAA